MLDQKGDKIRSIGQWARWINMKKNVIFAVIKANGDKSNQIYNLNKIAISN